jgi:hypothetical protein
MASLLFATTTRTNNRTTFVFIVSLLAFQFVYLHLSSSGGGILPTVSSFSVINFRPSYQKPGALLFDKSTKTIAAITGTTCPQRQFSAPTFLSLSSSSSSPSSSKSTEDGTIDAEDIDGIQKLFSKHCDGDGLMTKKTLESVPPFVDLLVRNTFMISDLFYLVIVVLLSPRKISNCSRITPRKYKMQETIYPNTRP